MQEMTAKSWTRRGCSIVWSPELLSPLITSGDAVPLRTALEWSRHTIPDPSGGGRTGLFGGAGLVFGMDGSGRLFHLNEADDLVYFGKGADRETKVCLTRAMWNGAATGTGVFKLVAEGAKDIGGFHVKHIS